ncbi:MAG: hypothetical protein EAX87_01195 [Candidatus Thorarchaeota archaeon]|nr:hypothetical protein [Candidatus Thorarchaeota archaeon]
MKRLTSTTEIHRLLIIEPFGEVGSCGEADRLVVVGVENDLSKHQLESPSSSHKSICSGLRKIIMKVRFRFVLQ